MSGLSLFPFALPTCNRNLNTLRHPTSKTETVASTPKFPRMLLRTTLTSGSSWPSPFPVWKSWHHAQKINVLELKHWHAHDNIKTFRIKIFFGWHCKIKSTSRLRHSVNLLLGCCSSVVNSRENVPMTMSSYDCGQRIYFLRYFIERNR